MSRNPYVQAARRIYRFGVIDEPVDQPTEADYDDYEDYLADRDAMRRDDWSDR